MLVVGAGNSGAEIAVELARNHRYGCRAATPGRSPRGPEVFPTTCSRTHHVVHGDDGLTVKTRLGRKVRDHFLDPPRGIPLGRVRRKDFAARRHRKSAASVRRQKRISGPRGWKGPRGVERHLVHRIHAAL